MSTPNTTQMTCPKCSTTFDIEQYNVINAQTQPELREKLLNGSMFLQTCPRCGTHMHAAYTCVYSNDEKKFLVSFQPSMRSPLSHRSCRNTSCVWNAPWRASWSASASWRPN